MYSNIECNEKLNAAGSLQACIAVSLMVRCPSAPSAPFAMSISLDNKLANEAVFKGGYEEIQQDH
jgi:hypothetical protein